RLCLSDLSLYLFSRLCLVIQLKRSLKSLLIASRKGKAFPHITRQRRVRQQPRPFLLPSQKLLQSAQRSDLRPCSSALRVPATPSTKLPARRRTRRSNRNSRDPHSRSTQSHGSLPSARYVLLSQQLFHASCERPSIPERETIQCRSRSSCESKLLPGRARSDARLHDRD